MRQTSKLILIRALAFGVLACVSSLLLTPLAAAQSAKAPAAPAARKAHAAVVKKRARVKMAINAEELRILLRRDNSRPLLVNFWATWCDLCREEFPDLVKIDKEYQATTLEFIAITLDDLADMDTEVPKFLRKMKARMPVYLLNVPDPDPAIHSVDAGWSGALPATFLYNNKGEVVYKQLGRIKPDELRAAIDKLVGEKQKAEGSKQ